jgi:hypothetical protein
VAETGGSFVVVAASPAPERGARCEGMVRSAAVRGLRRGAGSSLVRVWAVAVDEEAGSRIGVPDSTELEVGDAVVAVGSVVEVVGGAVDSFGGMVEAASAGAEAAGAVGGSCSAGPAARGPG